MSRSNCLICQMSRNSRQSESFVGFTLGRNQMRSIDESFYKSKTWRRVQENYMRSAHYFCERSKKKGHFIPAKIVHHKEHLSKESLSDPKKLYSFENLEALCLDCHNKEHFGRNRRYEIGKDGKLIFSEER